MEQAVSVAADHNISISKTESLKARPSGGSCRAGQFKHVCGSNPRRIETPVLALGIFQLSRRMKGVQRESWVSLEACLVGWWFVGWMEGGLPASSVPRGTARCNTPIHAVGDFLSVPPNYTGLSGCPISAYSG